MSGSEVSTHPTENVQKTKMAKNCFYTFVRKVESFPVFFTVFKVVSGDDLSPK